jgi:hypothetical protein
MEKTGSIEKFNLLLLVERGAWLDLRQAPPAAHLAEARQNIHTHLKEVGQSGDIGLILATEKALLVTDLTLYSNSPAMAGSLKTALDELKAAEALLPKAADPILYKAVDEAHSLPKNRLGGVPRDEARQFFRSHDARLVNMDKSRLDDEEKAIVDERKRNVRIGEKAYIALQQKALGLTSAYDHDHGLSR